MKIFSKKPKVKRCKECGFIIGHTSKCSVAKKCKHVFCGTSALYETTYNAGTLKVEINEKITTAQCMKCLLLFAFANDAHLKQWKKENKLSKKNFI